MYSLNENYLQSLKFSVDQLTISDIERACPSVS